MFRASVKLLMASALLVTGLSALLVTNATTAGAAPATSVLYNSTVSPLPGNLVSQCFECAQISELGNGVNLTSAGVLNNVVVTLSSWGCQSGGWSTDNCVTAPGATFNEPITLQLFNVGPNNSVGSLIGQDTQTFAVPYRPSADNTHCTATSGGPEDDQTGEWYDAADSSCYNGLATNITFDLSTQHLAVPGSLIYGIEYNTSGYGPSPYGYNTACDSNGAGPDQCGYDSLNIALTDDPTNVTTGSDLSPGQLYLNTDYAPYYCDGGAAGTGTFRLDSPNTNPAACPSSSGGWSINGGGAPYYVPAVQFNLASQTRLYTHAAVLELLPRLTLLAGPSATLLTQGGPVANQPILFTTPGGLPICVAKTDATGTAGCGAAGVLPSLLSLGFVAHYFGGGPYAPTAAFGPIIVLLGIHIF